MRLVEGRTVAFFAEPGAITTLSWLVLAAALYFFVLAVSNIVWLRLSCRRPRHDRDVMVSVLIPARDEERNIGRCLESLLHQTYRNYEIIVLDDQSSDGTWEIISRFARAHRERIKAVHGRPLPENGWHGKPHALHQLGQLAHGEYLLFTDADTVHAPESIAWAVTNLERHHVDFLSAYTGQELGTFGEALLVPIMYLMTAIVMPIWLIAATRAPVFTFAIGQLVMIRRKAYEAAGGYAAVSRHINDDIGMARAVRRAGFRTIFLDARRQVRCRMYEGFRASFNGLTKNISEFLNRQIASLVAGTLAVVVLFLLPYVFLLPMILAKHPAAGMAGAAVGLFQAAWCAMLYDRGLRWYVPFLYPAMFIFGVIMMWRGYLRLARGTGLVWKGRVIT
ncbi:MAG: glycosyltransferase family 2 protein [Spirochaetes bacterium]|nr:glycosyltransferase family 2 protein [Spirochaetota bacterium]